jgi:hypothetical protein
VSLHLAPNTPWWLLAPILLALIALSVWAYRFIVPPLSALSRRALPLLRALALAALIALLAQPVLERAIAGSTRLIVLLDRSRSMDLPVRPGGPPRSEDAVRAARELERAWHGRADVRVLSFAAALASDSSRRLGRDVTALRDALDQLAASADGQDANGVVVVSDGANNAGEDPVAAARRLALPVHAVLVGEARGMDRMVTSVEASSDARVGRMTPVRVRVETDEPRGTPLSVTLRDGTRELAHATVIAPGSGAEATAEFRVMPPRPGLAVWTASVDSLAGELTVGNDQRQVAVQVAAGRLGVTIVSGGLNWDLTFVRRGLLGDSSLVVTTWVRDREGWQHLESGSHGAVGAAQVRGQAVVVLDGVSAAEVGPEFDKALASFVQHDGGSVLAIGGELPGLGRLRVGSFGALVGLTLDPAPAPRFGAPVPAPESGDLLAWDDDRARGDRAWRDAAPLASPIPIARTAADRVLVGGAAGAPPLLVARRVGRGQVLLVNGTGIWRWSLSSEDDLAAERGRRLWRGLVHWLAEPVQGEPLRVKPERWLFAGGEPVRLAATLQDDAFRPVAGATVEGEITGGDGRARRVRFMAGSAGSYGLELGDLPPGRYQVQAFASLGGKALGRASSEFAVDRWSLEESRALPDSAALAALTSATGGRLIRADDVTRWSRELEVRSLGRGRTESVRLWESPWMFAVVVGALSLEWAWRRRRGLP